MAPAGGGAPIKGTVGGACHLITEQEASTAIGSAAGPGDEQGNTALSHCDWADGSLAITLVANGKPTFDHVVASLKAANNNGRWSAVHGLGTDAVVTHGGPLAMVYFMRGATLVNVILSGPGETARPDAAVIVARAAAGRL